MCARVWPARRGSPPKNDVGLRGDDYFLREESWRKVFQPCLSDAAAELLPIADQQLRKAHRDLALADDNSSAKNLPSRFRAAIEPHDQDQFPDPLGFLIDAARDCVEALLDRGSSQGYEQLDVWAATDVSLLRRLAIHEWIHRRDVAASAKLAAKSSMALE